MQDSSHGPAHHSDAVLASRKLESLGRIVDGIAHELDGLLAEIRDNAESSLREVSPQSPLCPRQQSIVEASRAAGELVRSLGVQAEPTRDGADNEPPSPAQCELSLSKRASKSASAERRGATGLASHHTVLVVDRDDGVRRLASTMLSRAGYRVRAVASGREALAALWRHADEINTVLLDLSLARTGKEAEMDGETTFLQLRELRPDLPVVFCSAHGSEFSMRLLRERERVAFAAKPYRLGDLTLKLRQAHADQ
jgi:CheY-like chemotaxis protein